MDVQIFVQNVKQLCKAKGISPSTACKEIGVGTSFIPDIKRGRIPSVDKFEKLADYLDTTVSDLLGEKKESTPVSESRPPDPLDARLNDLLAQATEETKQAMIALLEQMQKP